MKLLTLFSTLLVPGLALGSVLPSPAAHGSELEEGLAIAALNRLMRRQKDCSGVKCARDVTGTKNTAMPALTSRRDDCSSFMLETASYTETTTVTEGPAPAATQTFVRRQASMPANPANVVPTYASRCDFAQYSSVCSYWGVTATTTTVTSVSTVTVAPSIPTVTHTGILQVKNAAGTILGYIQPDLNYWTPQLTQDTNTALSISFETTDDSANQVDFKMNNDNRGTYFGFVVGRDSSSNDIASDSSNYLYIGPISASTGPGSTPQSVPSYFSTTSGVDKYAETALWNVDLATGAATASWVNSDGTTTVPTEIFIQSNHLYGGGSSAKFQSRFPSPVTTAFLTFIPI